MAEYYFLTALKAVTILLFVMMIIGAFMIAKYDSNLGRKIFYPSAGMCAAIIFAVG